MPPSASEIKSLFRELRSVLPESVPPSRLLRTLANHAAALKMLAREHPPADEDALRRALARFGALAGVLEEWASPPPPAGKKKTALPEDSEMEADAEAFSDPAAVSACDKVKVFVDGASKGNPGPAAIGLVVTDLEGNTLFEEGLYIGEMTNNAAEYRGLIRALEILREQGCPEAYFFSDSALMVHQMKGLWKVKHEGLKPLVAEAQALRRNLPRFQITHVPREKNKRADQLANLAFRQARDAGKI